MKKKKLTILAKDSGFMAWSSTEKAIFDDLRIDIKDTRDACIRSVTLQEEHGKQLEKLVVKTDAHADNLATLNAQYEEFSKRNDPRDKPTRMSAYAGVVSAVSAIIATAVAIAAIMK